MKNGWLLLLATSCHQCGALVARKKSSSSVEYIPLNQWSSEKDRYHVHATLDSIREQYEAQHEETTDDGKHEQPTHEIGWLAPQPEQKTPEIKCIEECKQNTYCWQGECVYRPWLYTDAPRKSCYADPEQPGLSDWDKSVCRSSGAAYDERTCTSTARYCRWLNDSPNWYRQLLNDRESQEHEEWLKSQEALKQERSAGDVAKDMVGYAIPGNPVIGSVLSSPDRRMGAHQLITDRGTR